MRAGRCYCSVMAAATDGEEKRTGGEEKPGEAEARPQGPADKVTFECNICLDTAKDAVISLCGHLFCWPCLHQTENSTQTPGTEDRAQSQRGLPGVWRHWIPHVVWDWGIPIRIIYHSLQFRWAEPPRSRLGFRLRGQSWRQQLGLTLPLYRRLLLLLATQCVSPCV
ncbi:uncharacterized protein [Narcine bancroftii]|uniref:uncharacterized protein isoform X4 n=1 Tax=Narcine bancroftii TaxID=1343680 RepID=UPI0038311178